jgi:2-polyprenyl-6-methoxyphenol hydroxylase-like FAD-dependent oxidoreductase
VTPVGRRKRCISEERDIRRRMAYGSAGMSTPANGPLPAVVIGGGVAGLAAARLLTRHYAHVIVLERDVRPDVATPEEAFDGWERPGVPQFRHSHAFLARLRVVLLAHLPDVLDRLREVGVRELALDRVSPPSMTLPPRADDEDVVLLACRRSTFEWALRASTIERPGIEIREGVVVDGLVAEPRNGRGPCVAGVRLADGQIVPAAIVVDASGRRSRAPEWLAALGTTPPYERSAEMGIFYYTRFYRLRRARAPRGTTGLVAGDLGWVKIAIFPGDNDTFSITVGAPVDEPRMKGLVDPARFERFVRAFPAIAPWRTRRASIPIAGPDTPVLVMGQLRNRLRRFVDRDGHPLAEGFFVIGDAAYHSNPIYGRGAPSGLVQATLLDEALGHHPEDLAAAARHLDRRSEAELRPYWEASVTSDRRARGDRRAFQIGSARAWLISVAAETFGWFVERALVPATRVDPVVFRGLMRVFNMLDPPDRLLTDPEVVLHALPVLARVLTGNEPAHLFPPVSREAAMARLDRAT